MVGVGGGFLKATPVKGDRTDGSGLDAQFRRAQLLRP